MPAELDHLVLTVPGPARADHARGGRRVGRRSSSARMGRRDTRAEFDAALDRARRAGLDVGVPVAAQRRRPDGTLLTWRLAAPYPLGLGGVQPFFIDWQGGAHPSDADLPWLELKELGLQHPDPVRAAAALHLLATAVEVTAGAIPRLTALLGTPAGDLALG